MEGNQPWAKNAPVLVLGLVKTTFAHNGKPNSAAEHDLGAASAFLTLEAVSRGLCVHQMIGIDPDKVIATFAPGPDIKPLTALAIGYQGQARAYPRGLCGARPEPASASDAERDPVVVGGRRPRLKFAVQVCVSG